MRTYSQIACSAHLPSGPVLIDLFAGAGGNSIAFAASGRWERVIAVERDAATLACAQTNARVYGVAAYVTFVLGDSLRYLDGLRAEGRKRSRAGRKRHQKQGDGLNVCTARGGKNSGGGGDDDDDDDEDCPCESMNPSSSP